MFFSWDWVTSNLNLDSNREVWLKVEVIADHVLSVWEVPAPEQQDRERQGSASECEAQVA